MVAAVYIAESRAALLYRDVGVLAPRIEVGVRGCLTSMSTMRERSVASAIGGTLLHRQREAMGTQ